MLLCALDQFELFPKGDTMTTAVLGATGRVGSEIIRGLLARGHAVAALVRDPDKPAASSANPTAAHPSHAPGRPVRPYRGS
jgi:nucleoside-diphosphate-sugar epimerase